MIVFPKGLTDKGTTPKWFMKKLDNLFRFDFDPCPFEWDKSFDGLSIDWKERNYVNPPYGSKLPWIKKGTEENKKGKLIVFFLPVDTSTIWFNDYLFPNSLIIFVKGRVTSDKGKTPAFSSMIAIMSESHKGICKSWNPKTQPLSEVLLA